jgi:hypothetical protein
MSIGGFCFDNLLNHGYNLDALRLPYCAGVAQSVEHLTCNETVVGSIPTASSRKIE